MLDSECHARVIAAIGPNVSSLHGRVNVVDRVELACPDRDVRAYHVMLVADAGAPIGTCQRTLPGPGRSACWLEQVFPALEDGIDLSANPLARAGIVAYGATRARVCDPTNDPEAFEACVQRYLSARAPTGGLGSALGEAIDEAVKRLVLTRSAATSRGRPVPYAEGIVAMAGAEPFRDDPTACRPAQRAVASARAEGMTVDVLCAHGDCASTCLADIGGERFTPAESWRSVVDYIGGEAWSTQLRVLQLTVHERLGAGFLLVDGSIEPSRNAVWDPGQRSITWSFDARNRDFVTLEYALAPASAGHHLVRPRVNGSYGILADTRSRTHAFSLGNAEISVGAAAFTALLPALSRGACDYHPCIRTAVAGAPPDR